MKYEIEIDPALIPEGWESVEFRPAMKDESCIGDYGLPWVATQQYKTPRLVLRKIKKLRPLTIREAFEAMIAGTEFKDGERIYSVNSHGLVLINSKQIGLQTAFTYYQVGAME